MFPLPSGSGLSCSVWAGRPGKRGWDDGRRGGGHRPAEGPDGIALATLHVSGEADAPRAGVPRQQGLGDLRSSTVAARRQIVLAAGRGMGGGAGMMRFTINGREFNEARTDTTVAVGDVEEWALTNTSPMDDPFHPPAWPMQVIEPPGQGVQAPVRQDVVNVPANGQVKVRVAFKDFHGRSAYHCHCHILGHEDLGMMGVIEVK